MNLEQKKAQMLNAISLIDQASNLSDDPANDARVKMLNKSAMIIIEDLSKNESYQSDFEALMEISEKLFSLVESDRNDQQLAGPIGLLSNNAKVLVSEIKKRKL
jgi:hypothetical protein